MGCGDDASGWSEAQQILWGDSAFLLDSHLAVLSLRHLHSERTRRRPTEGLYLCERDCVFTSCPCGWMKGPQRRCRDKEPLLRVRSMFPGVLWEEQTLGSCSGDHRPRVPKAWRLFQGLR